MKRMAYKIMNDATDINFLKLHNRSQFHFGQLASTAHTQRALLTFGETSASIGSRENSRMIPLISW